ncbi:MAG: hypothetical protein WCP55_01750 [Lentisphaerota bacterium]
MKDLKKSTVSGQNKDAKSNLVTQLNLELGNKRNELTDARRDLKKLEKDIEKKREIVKDKGSLVHSKLLLPARPIKQVCGGRECRGREAHQISRWAFNGKILLHRGMPAVEIL